jgi:hypothetical protein
MLFLLLLWTVYQESYAINGQHCSYSGQCYSSCCYLFFCKPYSTCASYSSQEYVGHSYSNVVSFTGLTKYSNGSSSSRGLSTGGIAGLGAVAGCVVVAVIIVVARVLLKKRNLRLALGRPSSRSAASRNKKYTMDAKNNPPVIIESRPMPNFMNNMTRGALLKNSPPPPLELKGVSSSPLRMASISNHRHSPKHFIPTAANTPIAPFTMPRGFGQQQGPTVQVQMVPSYYPVTMYANNNFHKR